MSSERRLERRRRLPLFPVSWGLKAFFTLRLGMLLNDPSLAWRSLEVGYERISHRPVESMLSRIDMCMCCIKGLVPGNVYFILVKYLAFLLEKLVLTIFRISFNTAISSLNFWELPWSEPTKQNWTAGLAPYWVAIMELEKWKFHNRALIVLPSNQKQC